MTKAMLRRELDLASAQAVSGILESVSFRLEEDLKESPMLLKRVRKARNAIRELGVSIHKTKESLYA